MRSRYWRWAVAAALLSAVAFIPWSLRPASGTTPFVITNLREDTRLSLMTYNIEGLPWPVRLHRSADLARIEDRLTVLRLMGQQPHIVALQEAFTPDAKRIGIGSGYRYIANGPDMRLAGASALSSDDRAFQSSADFFHGERSGKYVDSGLQILSDYPILSVRRMAFPAFACAGYDCLANKGAMLAMIAVPGLPEPVAVVNVHLNSRKASGVDDARSLYAYRRQIDALEAFLQSNIKSGTAVIVAGDFNVGRHPARRQYFDRFVKRWGARNMFGTIKDALGTCLSTAAPCGADMPEDARFSHRRGRDWQLSVPGAAYAMGVRGISVPFGHDLDGSMLSDHVGYTAYYGLIVRSQPPRAGA